MNPGTAVILNMLGGVALLLWGVRMVRTGVMRAWGDRLKGFIGQRLANRFSAFFAGIAATAVLGSGTAMSIIIAGIAATAGIGTSIGLAILLGADVGSALVTSVFASGSSWALWASPLLLFAGYLIFSYSEEFRPRNVGRILMGLGLTLLSLQLIKTATAPLSTASLFHELLAAVSAETLLAFIIGACLAWLFHSTLAAILLVASFLSNGSLALEAAISFILGINFGGGLPAVAATLQLPPAARRVPLANLFCRGLAAIIALSFSSQSVVLLQRLNLGPVETAVLYHALFNIGCGLLFLPFTDLVSWLMKRLVPEKREETDSLATPRYLGKSSVATPALALSHALLETVRMSELLDRMFETALLSLRTGKLETLKLLKGQAEQLAIYRTTLHGHLSDIASLELSKPEIRRALELMLYVSNLQHAGDVIHRNFAERIKAKSKEGVKLSDEEQASLDDLCLIIHDNLRLATGVLTSGDVAAARSLIAQKDAFRSLENDVLDEHFRNPSMGRGAALRRSVLYVDMIRDLHRINSHIVSAGYPIVDAAGLLRDSRLRETGT